MTVVRGVIRSRSARVLVLVLGGLSVAEAKEPVENLAPAPLEVGARLLPCAVELEHKFLGDDDVTWKTRRVPVWTLVREWDQARAMLPNATDNVYRKFFWIAANFGENDFSYHFDAARRTIKVDWDPVADSSVYTFHYRYDCGIAGAAADLRPYYADDAK